MDGAASERKKKTEVTKEIHQLRLKIQNLEREKSTHVYNKRGDFHKEFCHLQDMDTKMTQERKTENIRVTQQLSRIKGAVKRFQRELTAVKPTPEFVEKLKEMMEEIESHMTEFKDQQRQHYEEMIRDERVASQEVAALDKRFDSWSLQGAAVAADKPKSYGAPLSHRDITRDLPPEVTQFERFVSQSGGPRGGWDEYDHGTFLKFRNRHKGKLTFLRDLISFLPTKSDVEIRHHEEWYQHYLALNDKKKDAIQHWKDRKEIEKDEVVSKAVKDDETEVQRIQREQECQKEELDRERNVKRIQLNKWKIEKELERAQREEQELRQELQSANKQEKDRSKQIEIRRHVDEYKSVKKELEQQQKQEELWREQVETEEKQRQAQEMISKYRDRDLASVKEKKAKERAKKEAEDERKKKIKESLRERGGGGVRRDPSRLLQPTAGWKERQKDQGPSGRGQVIHMPHRAVPSWRQGLH